jgi:uncharacterized OB-fold protein/acyl dehydratase
VTTTTTGKGTGVPIAELQALVGSQGVRQVARYPVNEVMIAHWCDAMGDENPCYTDSGFAAASVHGGIVAPPAMLDVWDKKGLRSVRDPSSPRAQVLEVLDAHGFVSTVAVNSELTVTRYLRPGEVIGNVEVLDDVSAEKQTALGAGHFVTTRHRYTNEAGEHVGDVLFRILKFRPGTGRKAEPSAEAAADGGVRPDPDPALRPRPAINRDNQYFWDGARRHELRIQRCERCGHRSFPPSPRCPECGSFAMGFVVASGRGTLYAWAVPHHPQANGFRYPLLVGLVELEEGTRLVSNIVACAREDLRIGMPLEVCWLDSHPALVEGATDSRGPITLPQFRPARPPRRETTLAIDEVAPGDPLPLAPVPITPTLIVSGALATRDFTDVHHDRDIAVARGSKDIFMNIHTSLGLLQRYVTDWAGPEALVRALRVRLGAPNYPYDTMTMTGAVTAADAGTGEVTVSARGYNSLGDHITGTVELSLPVARRHGGDA